MIFSVYVPVTPKTPLRRRFPASESMMQKIDFQLLIVILVIFGFGWLVPNMLPVF